MKIHQEETCRGLRAHYRHSHTPRSPYTSAATGFLSLSEPALSSTVLSSGGGERARNGTRRGDTPPRSDADEVRQDYEGDAEGDKQEEVRDDIRKGHQSQATDQRDHGVLLLAIQKEAKPERAKHQAPQQRCRTHGWLPCRVTPLNRSAWSALSRREAPFPIDKRAGGAVAVLTTLTIYGNA